MNTLVEIQKERETKLKSARLEAGFYNVIGGQRAVAASQLSVINPATGEELATVPDIPAISLDDAVAAARKAFPSWRTLPLERRKEAVARVLIEIDSHADELSTLLTAEQGRPLFQARLEIDLLTKHYGPALIQMDIPEFEQRYPQAAGGRMAVDGELHVPIRSSDDRAERRVRDRQSGAAQLVSEPDVQYRADRFDW